ncbi:MAG: BtpA/SgcQ family protein [Candidatus Aenigmatarchaeota archaeon]
MGLGEIFPVSKPIIAMVHVQYNPRIDKQQLLDMAMTDVERLECGGVDGLLFENWGGEYTSVSARDEEVGCLDAVMRFVSGSTKLPYGVNVLPLDYKADRQLADNHGAKFVQVDTFVDAVKTDYKNRFVIRPNSEEIRQTLSEYFLMINIQTKHYQILPPNKKLETSARQAIGHGADALVVTGVLTGKRTPRKKISTVRRVAEPSGVPIINRQWP